MHDKYSYTVRGKNTEIIEQKFLVSFDIYR